MSDPSPNRDILVKYAVLVSLTPLIPIPFLDDLAQSYFERRMVERLVQARGLALTPEQLDGLTSPPPEAAGCARGCLYKLLIYPIKKIFQKIFFFLEIKAALDLLAVTYAKGHLLDHVLGRGLCAPAGPHPPPQVRAATERAVARVGTSPIGLAARRVYEGSGALLRAAVEPLIGALRRLSGRPSREQLGEAVRSVEEQATAGVDAQIKEVIDRVPASHFEQLEAAVLDELSGPAPSGPKRD